MVERCLQWVGTQLTDLGADAGEFRRHHVDLRELFPGKVVRDQDVTVRRRRRRILQQRAHLVVAQTKQATDTFDHAGDFFRLRAGDFRAQRHIEIALRSGEHAAAAIIDRPAVRRSRLELDAHIARLGFKLRLTEQLQLCEAHDEAAEHHGSTAKKDHAAGRK